MSFPYQALEDSGADVAAAVHESFLNNFSKAHFRAAAKLYTGEVVFDDFQSRVRVGYKIEEPLIFDLTPLPQSKIRQVLLAHFNEIKKSANAETYIDAFAPPNVNVTGKKVTIAITVFKGHTGEEDFSVDFDWSVEARCLVYFKEYTPEKKAIRLEAIRVAFTQSNVELLKEIASKIKSIGRSGGGFGPRALMETRTSSDGVPGKLDGAMSGPSDPEWCTKLEKLFLFLVNQVLAVQFTNFINEWELPRSIEIAQGASITPSLLSIGDNYLIVGAQVNVSIDHAVTQLQASTTRLLEEFADQYNHEFSGMTDEEFKAWEPSNSSSFKWLKERHALVSQVAGAPDASPSGGKAYDKNLIVLSNSELFNAIAKANLKASGSQNYSKKLDHLVKAEAGWWFTVGPSTASIIQGGISVETSAEIGGYVRGCIPDLNPKHWGDWACQGICIELETKDFGVQARPSFDKDGIYCRFSIKPGSSIAFRLCNAPGWLNDLLGWITSLFTRALLDILSTIISTFKFKIVDYPEHFPGTALEWKPRLNPALTNQLSYLEVSGDPTFV